MPSNKYIVSYEVNSFQTNYTLTSNSLVEDSGGSTEVEWTTGRVDIATFAQVRQILDFVSVEMT